MQVPPRPPSRSSAAALADTGTSQQQHNQEQQQVSFRARRYAIRLSPPSIFLEYEDPDGKRRVRAVKLVNISTTTDVDRLTRKVIRSFPRRLDTASVKYEQVRKLVFRLVESVRQQQQQQAGGAPGQLSVQVTGSSNGNGGEGEAPGEGEVAPISLLPTVSPKLGNPQLARVQLMDSSAGSGHELRHSSESRFSTSTDGGGELQDLDQAHMVHGGETEQQHAGTMHARSASGKAAQGVALDDLEDMLGELDRELAGGRGGSIQGTQTYHGGGAGPRQQSGEFLVEEARVSSSGTHNLPLSRLSNSGSKRDSGDSAATRPATASVSQAATPGQQQQHRATPANGMRSKPAADEDDDGPLVLDVDLPEDLNKVSEVELQLAKMRMEQDFQRNRILPGHKDYEYDKQVEFSPPTEANEWDD